MSDELGPDEPAAQRNPDYREPPVDPGDAAGEQRMRTIDGLRHIDDQIALYNDALAYVRENGHGNAEGVLTRIIRDLQTLKTIPLPADEDAEPESDEPITVAHRRIGTLEQQVGRLVAASPHANINTTTSIRSTPAPNDRAGLPPPLPHERQLNETQSDFEARVRLPSYGDEAADVRFANQTAGKPPPPGDPRWAPPVDTDGAASVNDRSDARPGTF